MKLIRILLCVSILLTANLAAAQDIVLEDDGVTMTRQELEFIVSLWSPDMQRAAALDEGDRLELINIVLASKKIAREFERMDPATVKDPDAYWRHVLAVRDMNRKFVVEQYMKDLEMPDLEALAKERYTTQKNKYAWVAEQRKASQILLLCLPGRCDRDALRPKAAQLLERLRAGEDFEQLAAEFNQDPGTQQTNGRMDRWLTLGMVGMDPHQVGGVFSVEKVGGYSEVTDTPYGLHIFRLDEIQEGHYRPYEEVREAIIADLAKEYRDLAAKEFDARFMLTDELKIDKTAVEKILEPYAEALAPPVLPEGQ